MRTLIILMLAMLLATPVRADPSKLAVFDFELIDNSAEGGVPQAQLDAQAERLILIGDLLRRELTESGKYQLMDITPVNAAAHRRNLQGCGGCDVDYAKQIGADLSLTGVVNKVSNLILNITIYLHDVSTGQLVAVMNTDLRGNTDESWTRAVRYLIRNRLLQPNYGAPHLR